MKENVRVYSLLFGDLCALIIALFLGNAVNNILDVTTPSFQFLINSYTPLFLIWLLILYICELYNILDLSRIMLTVKRLGVAIVLMVITGVGYFYLLTSITPKTDLLIIVACTALIILGWRFAVGRVFGNHFKSGVLLLGSHALASELAAAFAANPQFGFSPITVARTIEETEIQLKNNSSITLIIMSERSAMIDDAALSYLRRGYRIMDLGEAYETYLARIPVTFVDASWILHKVQMKFTILTKAFDELLGRFVALLVGTIFSPVILAIVIAIKIEDRGPIFYTQERVGKLGKIFKLYKFRSMSIHAEKNGAQWAQQNDARVTRVGAITRKLHVDELAQIINILRGDIALVGPRPERPEFVERLEKEVPHYNLRHIVKPGFTGWAQIKFRYARSVMDSQEKLEYDLFYIKNKNIFMDLGIIAKTVQIIVTHH